MEKAKKQIADEMAVYVTPKLSDHVKAVDRIRKERAGIEKQLNDLEERCAGSQAALVQAEAKVSETILANGNPGAHLRQVELRRAEIDAFGRQASKLRRDDAELAEKEKAALKALESVLWASLLEYRSILEDRVKGLLDESLALMASFEDLLGREPGTAFWSPLEHGRELEAVSSAAASLAAVKAGRAHVEVMVLITRIGVSAEGHMCSHGKKSHLFSVNLDQPPGSDGGASAQATH